MDDQPVTNLSETECWDLLATQQMGRLATSAVNEPSIAPVNFVVDDHTLVFRTAQGSKLLELTVNDRVAFEVDEFNDATGWSVVVRGTAEALERGSDIEAAEQLGLKPWVATRKKVFVRIRPTTVSGRRFVFGAEPHYWQVPQLED